MNSVYQTSVNITVWKMSVSVSLSSLLLHDAEFPMHPFFDTQHSLYLTRCSTNSGALSTSLHLVSTRTMLWWRPWPKRLRYHLEWSNSMEDLLRISTPVLDLEFPMWVWRFCTRAITTTSSTHTLLLPRVQVSRPPEEIILLIRVGSQQILLDVAEFRW